MITPKTGARAAADHERQQQHHPPVADQCRHDLDHFLFPPQDRVRPGPGPRRGTPARAHRSWAREFTIRVAAPGDHTAACAPRRPALRAGASGKIRRPGFPSPSVRPSRMARPPERPDPAAAPPSGNPPCARSPALHAPCSLRSPRRSPRKEQMIGFEKIQQLLAGGQARLAARAELQLASVAFRSEIRRCRDEDTAHGSSSSNPASPRSPSARRPGRSRPPRSSRSSSRWTACSPRIT